jgi:hypothetical protein
VLCCVVLCCVVLHCIALHSLRVCLTSHPALSGVGRIYTELPELEVDMPPRAYDYLRDVLDTLFEQDNLSEAVRGQVS